MNSAFPEISNIYSLLLSACRLTSHNSKQDRLQEELSPELGIYESRFAPGALQPPDKRFSGGSEELTNTFFEG